MMKKENNMNQYINDSDFDLNYIQYESNNNEEKNRQIAPISWDNPTYVKPLANLYK